MTFLRVSLYCVRAVRIPVRALTPPLIAFTFSSKVRFGSFMVVHQVSFSDWRIIRLRIIRLKEERFLFVPRQNDVTVIHLNRGVVWAEHSSR